MTFKPEDHLMNVSGKAYMQVQWRLVWLRSDHPNARIMTALIEHDPGKYAMFRAEIILDTGGMASGYGSETSADFRDYLEKSETKSIGRALAALGYGTQFAGLELDEGERIVDSPVERKSTPKPPPQPRQQATELETMFTPDGEELTYFEAKSKAGKTYYQMTSDRCVEHDSPWFSFDLQQWSHGKKSDGTWHGWDPDSVVRWEA